MFVAVRVLKENVVINQYSCLNKSYSVECKFL